MKRYALIFPGQASQYAGMDGNLRGKYAQADPVFDEAEEILELDFRRLCNDKNQLMKTENAQLCIFVCSVAAFKVIRDNTDYNFQFFAGHSIGEYAALTCSGMLDFQDALKLIQVRGRLMGRIEGKEEVCMAVVKTADNWLIQKECEKASSKSQYVSLICDNSDRQKIIAGSRRLVEQVITELENNGINAHVINSLGAFHTKYMLQAQELFAKDLAKVTFHKVPALVMSNVTGKPYLNENTIYEILSRQLSNTVRWRQSISYLKSKGVDGFIEVGAGKTLHNILKSANHMEKVVTFDNTAELFHMLRS
jgi:[acyl-carrier-protein] S-malonyltransferase